MGRKREREQQEQLFYASEQAEAPGHPFYEQLNRVLEEAKFDSYCESQCAKFYHAKLGRPHDRKVGLGIAPGGRHDAGLERQGRQCRSDHGRRVA